MKAHKISRSDKKSNVSSKVQKKSAPNLNSILGIALVAIVIIALVVFILFEAGLFGKPAGVNTGQTIGGTYTNYLSCSDSDGGYNPNVSGTVSYTYQNIVSGAVYSTGQGTLIDSCVYGTTHLREKTCQGNAPYTTELSCNSINPTWGCNVDKCTPNFTNYTYCADSDGGSNLNVSGYVNFTQQTIVNGAVQSVQNLNWTDACASGDVLTERTCAGNAPYNTQFSCNATYPGTNSYCYNGRCTHSDFVVSDFTDAGEGPEADGAHKYINANITIMDRTGKGGTISKVVYSDPTGVTYGSSVYSTPIKLVGSAPAYLSFNYPFQVGHISGCDAMPAHDNNGAAVPTSTIVRVLLYNSGEEGQKYPIETFFVRMACDGNAGPNSCTSLNVTRERVSGVIENIVVKPSCFAPMKK